MLDIPDAEVLDKVALIGGCLRLPLPIDAERLRLEIARLPAAVWGSSGGRIGVHAGAQALFLRGYAPAEGEKPVHDREVLDQLPYARSIIERLIPAPPLRCLLARLPPGAGIAPHIDRAGYFSKTLRLHVPIETNERVFMMSNHRCYRMLPGELWALNNSTFHAVWNAHPSASRTHMICDFLPSAALLNLLAQGERDLGFTSAEADVYFAGSPAKKAAVSG
jgi:hypothetical protein